MPAGPDDGDRQPQPLWATSIAELERREAEEDERRREEAAAERRTRERTPAPAPVRATPPTPPARRKPLTGALVVLAVVVLAMLATALPGPSKLSIAEVPSYWQTIGMRCETLRIAENGQAIEVFHCNATRGGSLPPGVYRPPFSVWTSDVTRQESARSAIRISADGDLHGWAAYVGP